MNKLEIIDDEIIENSPLKDIKYSVLSKNKMFDVTSIKIQVLKSTDIMIIYSGKSTKLDVFFNIFPDVKVNIMEIKTNTKLKVQNKYYIEQNSIVNITKFNDVSEIKDMSIINLNGPNAKINYNLKTISKDEEKYDVLVYHNAFNTESNIKNNGVNIKDGKLTFNVSSFAPKGKKQCTINQNNRIINLTNNKCEIKPNLFIDENDVTANHSALIGTFSDEELFYMESRGLKHQTAQNLLIKGFLLSNIDNNLKSKIETIISKYWR